MSDRIITHADASDEELITQFQNGNESAFSLLVSRFKNPLMNYVYRYIGDRDEAEDIVQETFVKVYNNANAYKPIAKFSTWIYTVAGNLARTAIRRKKIGQVFSIFKLRRDEDGGSFDIPDMTYSAEKRVEERFRSDAIQKALGELEESHREIIILSDIQEFSYEEICTITGLKMGTVKSRLNRAHVRLRELLNSVRNDL